MTAVEGPGVIARIFLIRKFGATALPFQSHSVFGHVVYIGPHERAATAGHKDRTVAPRSKGAARDGRSEMSRHSVTAIAVVPGRGAVRYSRAMVENSHHGKEPGSASSFHREIRR